MRIEESQIRRLAHLARLHLDEQEVRLFTGQLERILEYVEQLSSLNTDGVEPLAHALPLANVVREDEPADGLPAEAALANAPQREQDFFRVPAVLDPAAGA